MGGSPRRKRSTSSVLSSAARAVVVRVCIFHLVCFSFDQSRQGFYRQIAFLLVGAYFHLKRQIGIWRRCALDMRVCAVGGGFLYSRVAH